MPNSNSQIDGLGSFYQSAENAGTMKYGAFNNASKNTGNIALSAMFSNTSQNLGTIGDVLPITTATIVQSNSANWDSAYTTVHNNSGSWSGGGDGGSLSGVLHHVSEDLAPSLGGDLDINNHHIYGGNYRGNQIHLPIGFGVYIKSLYEGAVNLQVGINGTAQKSWVFDKDGFLSLPQNGAVVTTNGDSDQWNSSYTTVMQNSAMWALSGGITPTETFVGDVVTSIINTDSFVLTTDSRLSDIFMGVDAHTFLQSNSGNFITEDDSRLSNARTPISHTHDASSIISGKLDVDRIPVLPSMEVVVIDGVMYSDNAFYGSDENLVIDGFTYQLSAIEKGTVVTTTDGNRYVYKGEGGKRFASSYIQLADMTPVWSVITNKPATFPPSYHTHTIADIEGLSSHSHLMSNIIGLSDAFNLKTNLSEYTSLKTTVSTNSATWNKGEQGYTAYTYVSANSANIVMTSDNRLSKATTAHTYLTANSASIVVTSDSRLANATTAYTSVQSNSATWAVGAKGSINYTIDGGGAAISTGSKGFVQVPTNFIVQEWDIIADLQTTSFIVDVRKSSYANLPTTTSIVGSDLLILTNQQKNRNLSVSWTNISAGDFVEFYVTNASNASMINISLKGIRS